MCTSPVAALLRRRREAEDAELAEADIVALLRMPPHGEDFYRLLAASDARSRACYGSRGYVFAQIGLNAEPCSKNCAFCSMGGSHYRMDARWRKDIPHMEREIAALLAQGIDDLFLMTTADFPQEEALRFFAAARAALPDTVRLVANIGDLDACMARRLRDCGCDGAYHIRRLGEGRDTGIPPRNAKPPCATCGMPDWTSIIVWSPSGRNTAPKNWRASCCMPVPCGPGPWPPCGASPYRAHRWPPAAAFRPGNSPKSRP